MKIWEGNLQKSSTNGCNVGFLSLQTAWFLKMGISPFISVRFYHLNILTQSINSSYFGLVITTDGT